MEKTNISRKKEKQMRKSLQTQTKERQTTMGYTFEEWGKERTERAGAMGEGLLRETRLTLD